VVLRVVAVYVPRVSAAVINDEWVSKSPSDVPIYEIEVSAWTLRKFYEGFIIIFWVR
jgi:hypothetical protein